MGGEGYVVIDSVWTDDFVFNEAISDYDAGDSIYEDGWVLWSGCDVTTATDDSDVTPGEDYHVKDGDVPINVDDPQTQIDTNGVIEVTTSGYTESALSGKTMIGPFQSGMKLTGDWGTDDWESGQWIHLMRIFECLDSDSYVTVSYDLVYCLQFPDDHNPRHWSSLWITGDGGTDEHDLFYDEEFCDDRLPPDAVDEQIDGAYHITPDSNTQLLSECDVDNGSPINVIPVSHEYALGVISSSFQVQIRNRLLEEEGWFMISDIEIQCSSSSNAEVTTLMVL